VSLSAQLAVARRDFTVEVELDVAAETLVIVGPSGCGKTTVLRALAGLLAPARARIRLDGRLLHDTEQNVALPPERRQVGVVFQNYALFPHLDVAATSATAWPQSRASSATGGWGWPWSGCGSPTWPAPDRPSCRAGNSSASPSRGR